MSSISTTEAFALVPPEPTGHIPSAPMPFIPRRDKDGTYPIGPNQTATQLIEYFDNYDKSDAGKAEKKAWRELQRAERSQRAVSERSLLFEKWDEQGERGHAAQLMYDRGLWDKARHYSECQIFGQRGDCPADSTHRFIDPFHCGLRFCSYCGPRNYRRIWGFYAPRLRDFFRDRKHPKGYVLARINFTLRRDGEEFDPADVKKFNEAIRRTLRRAVGLNAKRRIPYGVLWADEVGFEEGGRSPERTADGWNLHAHGIYYGPFINWERARDIWKEETKRAFDEESYGFTINAIKGWRANPVRGIRTALAHLLKYVRKPPAVTPERTAALEAAFHKARRVHGGGLWHGLPSPEEDKGGAGDILCPDCKTAGIKSFLQFRMRVTASGRVIPEFEPIEDLESLGYRRLEREQRKSFFASPRSWEELLRRAP